MFPWQYLFTVLDFSFLFLNCHLSCDFCFQKNIFVMTDWIVVKCHLTTNDFVYIKTVKKINKVHVYISIYQKEGCHNSESPVYKEITNVLLHFLFGLRNYYYVEVENAKCFYRQKQNSEFKQNKKLGKINKQLKQHIFCSKYQVKAWKNVLSHHPFFEGKKTNKQKNLLAVNC